MPKTYILKVYYLNNVVYININIQCFNSSHMWQISNIYHSLLVSIVSSLLEMQSMRHTMFWRITWEVAYISLVQLCRLIVEWLSVLLVPTRHGDRFPVMVNLWWVKNLRLYSLSHIAGCHIRAHPVIKRLLVRGSPAAQWYCDYDIGSRALEMILRRSAIKICVLRLAKNPHEINVMRGFRPVSNTYPWNAYTW